uniref:Putative secreted protein n=1 Tax=Amblyomma cajennense TaxID=34607 RepID=A0A023FDR1_AMBCJ
MRFRFYAALLIVASLLQCCVEACSQGKQWSFCPREGTPNGRRCPELWPTTCAWLSIQCGCPLGKYEHENGSCVEKKYCVQDDRPRKHHRVFPTRRKPSLRGRG